MAIVIPGTLELLPPSTFLGHLHADDEPLRTLLNRSNWHYATHAPALLNCCPLAIPLASQDFAAAATPSADGLTYDCDLALWLDVNSTIVITFRESSTSSSAGWSVVAVSSPFLTAGDNRHSFTVPLAATTKYLRITVASVSGLVQCQSWLVRPRKLTTITAPASPPKPSGSIPFDDAHLSTVGAAVHVEYLNRAWENFRATQADRRQAVLSYVQASTSPTNIFRVIATGQTAPRVLYGASWIPETQITATVRFRASDLGVTDGTVRVGQVGGDVVEFVCDDSDQTATITLTGPDPVIYAQAEPVLIININYITIDYSPVIGSSSVLISEPAPPARMEYLAAVDALGLQATLGGYAVTGLHFNALAAGGTDWHWAQMIGAGHDAMRGIHTRSTTQTPTTVGPPDAEMFSSSSGATASDEIIVPCPASGVDVYPPLGGAVVVKGSLTKDTTPAAPVNRLFELTPSREPLLEEFNGRLLIGFTGEPILVADPATLP